MRAVIFDFDGTIADSFELFIDVFHVLAKRDDRLPPAEIEKLRGLSVRQAAKAVHFPLWKLPFVRGKGFRMMYSRIDEVRPVRGMSEAIKQLQDEGYRLYIISSNTVENIESFLKTHGMEGIFLHIYGGVGVFGKAKALRRMMKINNLAIAETVYVGDEVRDVDGAKRAGVPVVAVTWGYNNAEVIAKHKPDMEVTTPAELLTTLGRMLQ